MISEPADTNGNLVLTSVSGADIEVNHGGNSDFIYAYKDVNGTVSQSGVQGDLQQMLIHYCCRNLNRSETHHYYPPPI